MSQKWIRSKKWDDEHLKGALLPVKLLLRTFSSIWLAVILLSVVALYGILAAVPVGLLALFPTFAIYALVLLATLGFVALLPSWILSRVMRSLGAASGLRFAVVTLASLGLLTVGWLVFRQFIWPEMRYDRATGQGLRLFGEFVDRYKSTTIRRMPGVELTEIEFYSAWPLRVVLLAFIANMVTATVRRIEFTFPNLGVLTVHSGIVTLALGSVYYGALKQEGDVRLIAGDVDPASGKPAPGIIEDGFYDQIRLALWVKDNSGRWEQRPLRGIPRYNDYNIDVVKDPDGDAQTIGYAGHRDNGPLDLVVPPGPGTRGGISCLTGEIAGWVGPFPFFEVAEATIRVVGYVNYTDWTKQSPVRNVDLVRGDPETAPPSGPGSATPGIILAPSEPAQRAVSFGDTLGIEYLRGVSPQRWADLMTPLPQGALHGVVVRVPGSAAQTYAIRQGETINVGATGYSLLVKAIHREPPLPIITPGYRDAPSSLIIVRVTPPDGAAYDRWIYHRFPELNQDLLDPPAGQTQPGPMGMQSRRKPDAGIDIVYVDAASIQVYFDEELTGAGGEPRVRAIYRQQGGRASVIEGLKTGSAIEIAPGAFIRLGRRELRSVPADVPYPTPEDAQNKQAIGTHQRAALAVEVRVPRAGRADWTHTVWLPFMQYFEAQAAGMTQAIRLPDGQRLEVAFGRLRRQLPRLAIQLVDFEMIPYPGGDDPQDFRSMLTVTRFDPSRREGDQWVKESHLTSLNAPLLVPVAPMVSENAGFIERTVAHGLNALAPMRYKFSQVGWDASGWMETLQKTRAQELPRPVARFTILGVGNNPGIRIIAIGGVMMGVGIPWAFYVKPMIMKRRKQKLQKELAATKSAKAAGAEIAGGQSSAAANGTSKSDSTTARAGGGVQKS